MIYQFRLVSRHLYYLDKRSSPFLLLDRTRWLMWTVLRWLESSVCAGCEISPKINSVIYTTGLWSEIGKLVSASLSLSLSLSGACVCDSASVNTTGDRLQGRVQSVTRRCNKTRASLRYYYPQWKISPPLFPAVVVVCDSTWFSDRRFCSSSRSRYVVNKKQRKKLRKGYAQETKQKWYLLSEWLGETATDARKAWKDDRVAAPDHHGPEWPTHHVTVLFSRITKSTGEFSMFRAYSLSTDFKSIIYRSSVCDSGRMTRLRRWWMYLRIGLSMTSIRAL